MRFLRWIVRVSEYVRNCMSGWLTLWESLTSQGGTVNKSFLSEYLKALLGFRTSQVA
jgi:hypothetical protein